MALLMKMLINRGQSPASHPNRAHSSGGRRAEVEGEEVSFNPGMVTRLKWDLFPLLLMH